MEVWSKIVSVFVLDAALSKPEKMNQKSVNDDQK